MKEKMGNLSSEFELHNKDITDPRSEFDLVSINVQSEGGKTAKPLNLSKMTYH